MINVVEKKNILEVTVSLVFISHFIMLMLNHELLSTIICFYNYFFK